MKRLETLARLLHSQTTLALATSGNGAPLIAPLFYVAGDGLRLYWFSSSASEHCRALEANPKAAVTVYQPARSWKKICGVQMRGRVSVIRDPVRRKSIAETYQKRFRLGSLFQGAVSRSELYEFQPSWIRYIDNSRRFGFKFEIDVSGL